MPTVRETATVTVTTQARQRWSKSMAAIADAFRAIGQAVADLVTRIREAFGGLAAGNHVERRQSQPRSYPGTSATFERRGRKR